MTHLESHSPMHLEWIPYIDRNGSRCKLIIDTTTLDGSLINLSFEDSTKAT